MPKILELRVIDDKVWARVDMPDNEQSVTLWTEHEKERLMAEVREQIVDEILAKNTSGFKKIDV